MQVTIQCNSMETCGDIIQDFVATHMKLPELESEGFFPQEMQKLGDLLGHIQQSNALKTHFGANISESINNLKVFIVKAEASLMIGDM